MGGVHSFPGGARKIVVPGFFRGSLRSQVGWVDTGVPVFKKEKTSFDFRVF